MTEPVWVALVTQGGSLLAAVLAAVQARSANHQAAHARQELTDRDLVVSERLARLEATVEYLVRAVQDLTATGRR